MDNNLGISFKGHNGKETVISRADSRERVILAFLLAMMIAVTKSTISVSLLFVYSIILIVLAGIPSKRILKRLTVLDGILLTLWITLPLSAGGASFHVGPITIYREGIRLALLITIKANSALLSIYALLGTMSFIELFNALEDLKVPRKLLLLTHFTFRYADVIATEADVIYKAMLLRGFTHKFRIKTLRGYGLLMGMIFVKSYRRADRVMMAMELRGFDGTFRSLRERNPLTAREAAGLALPVIIAVGCCVL